LHQAVLIVVQALRPFAPLIRSEQRHHQQRYNVSDLDQRVDGRSSGVLVRVANRVAGDWSFVRIGALATQLPSSMYFFALSQAPPPAVMEIATKSPVTIVPRSWPPSAFRPF